MRSHPRILVVDDEESIRISLDLFLSEHFQLDSVASAEEALEIANRRKFAVALIDIGLDPKGNSGIWLLKQLKEHCPTCQIIMITADHRLQQVLDCYSLGAYGYITKPWNVEETTWLVRRASERHRLTEQNAFLLARIMEQPKIPVKKAKSSALNVSQLVAPISKRLKHIDKSTMKNIGKAQDELKRQVLVTAMQQAGWNQVHAAKLLGIKRVTLRQNLSSLGIVTPVQRGRPQI